MIYGDLASICGYTYPEIDAMTLPQYVELCGYWARKPPVQAMVQAFLKIETKAGSPPKAEDKPVGHSIEQLKALFPNGVMMGR